ncbi:MAG: anti-sigma factor antagonist [Fibrobacteria bacterium]|nr:anti-sigma factor antagonist [Fibrobacteria bacterium]
MIRLKRTGDLLVFELIPPFNEDFFIELKTTIKDFIKIGKRNFSYDFSRIDSISFQDATNFERILPLFKRDNCLLKFSAATDTIKKKLPLYMDYILNEVANFQDKGNFFIDCRLSQNIAVINLIGEFTEQDALEEFKSKSSHYLAVSDAIVLECSELRFVSTLAIGGFVYLKIQCDKVGKEIIISNVSEAIESSLKMAGIMSIIQLTSNLDDAMNLLGKSKH